MYCVKVPNIITMRRKTYDPMGAAETGNDRGAKRSGDPDLAFVFTSHQLEVGTHLAVFMPEPVYGTAQRWHAKSVSPMPI